MSTWYTLGDSTKLRYNCDLEEAQWTTCAYKADIFVLMGPGILVPGRRRRSRGKKREAMKAATPGRGCHRSEGPELSELISTLLSLSATGVAQNPSLVACSVKPTAPETS